MYAYLYNQFEFSSGEVYSIHYVIKFVIDFPQVGAVLITHPTPPSTSSFTRVVRSVRMAMICTIRTKYSLFFF